MDTLDQPPDQPLITFFRVFITAANQAEILDPLTISIEAIVLVIGLLFSAIYSGSEVAFFSMVNQMDKLNRDQTPGGPDSRIIRMLEKPRRLLATILIGNTFANVISSVLAAVITGKIVAAYGFSEFLVYTIEIIVLTFMILILSEITPKVIAINNPLKTSRQLSGFIYFHYMLFTPVSKLIAESAIGLEKWLPKQTSRMTAQDIKTIAEVSESEGSIRGDEREIIENVIEFGNITVREIMTSRVNIVAVSVDSTLEEVITQIRQKQLSRMPLYQNDLDNIKGVIFAKDVLPYINSDLEKSAVNWQTIARKALFIPSTKKLDDLLRDFQHEKTHIAIVVDEYGGTEGLVTLDDLLEEIVGDISDEYDETEEKLYTRFKSGVYIFDAKIDLDDLDDILGTELSSPEDEFETLGGLVYHLTERLPNVGERLTYKGLELTVHNVENNRVKKLRVQKTKPSEKVGENREGSE